MFDSYGERIYSSNPAVAVQTFFFLLHSVVGEHIIIHASGHQYPAGKRQEPAVVLPAIDWKQCCQVRSVAQAGQLK